tara:strand:+ start:493 stop:717 length:225 start_codon:yes stop_codon:yes gene_type:complete
MANCSISDVVALILPPGVRPDATEIKRIQEAINTTAAKVSPGADYFALNKARLANAAAAAAKLVEVPKAKAKAK